ncbi:MAG: hypothetical protein H7A38_06420 [Chlamydiales bacterium]|nr:hypothetical protein [Chlamydiales bacterium]
MIDLETYTGGPLFFEIDLTVDEPDFSKQIEENRDFLNGLRQEGKSLETISSEAEKTVRSVSPILLGDNPFQDSDPWIVKCLLSVYHAMRVLFLETDEIQKALETYQGSQEVIQHIKNRADTIEQEVNQNYQNTLRVHFTLEAMKVIETGGDGNAFVEAFVSSYSALLHARTFVFEGGEKVSLTSEKRAELLASFRDELVKRRAELDPSQATPENRKSLQEQLDILMQERKALTEKLHALDEFIRGPLDRQISL